MDNGEALEQERVAAILEETSRAFINTSLVRGVAVRCIIALRSVDWWCAAAADDGGSD